MNQYAVEGGFFVIISLIALVLAATILRLIWIFDLKNMNKKNEEKLESMDRYLARIKLAHTKYQESVESLINLYEDFLEHKELGEEFEEWHLDRLEVEHKISERMEEKRRERLEKTDSVS